MRKTIQFSKAFLPCAIVSIALIIFGAFGFFTKGINYGLDFQAGFVEKVKIAPTALSLTYTGNKSVAVEQSSSAIRFIVTSVGDENVTHVFRYVDYPTVGAFKTAVANIEGITVSVKAPEAFALSKVFPDSQAFSRLSATPYRFHYLPAGIESINSDEVRNAISETYSQAVVQVLGDPSERFFQIRIADDGTDSDASVNLYKGLNSALYKAFGDDSVAVISSDFVGSRLSSSLAKQSALLVLATLVLIWVYAAFRFRWDFALAAVIAIFHDALIMIMFIVWTGMQFNSTTIAAILTILGYSLNATVVIFDRIRENMKIYPNLSLTEHLDLSLTEMLSRSILTTFTTMLAVSSLYFFTSGDMKDFALALLVGMLSGVYSSMYISSAFIKFVSKFRKDGDTLIEKKEKPRLANAGELV